ncbi:MAG: acyl-CoA dehydrogenase [Methylobacteriaceae bacterium]|nr:acyl-CoA dehydrogenase [Methylobacteriaceae bacterium]
MADPARTAPTGFDALAAARALTPALRARAADTEARAGLPPETMADLAASRLYRLLQPARRGGAEAAFETLVDVTAELARGDASVAWTYASIASRHWALGMFAAPAQAAVWDQDPDAAIASSLVFSGGRARRVEGGWRVSGRWPFASGAAQSDWLMLGGVATLEAALGEDADYRLFLLPRAAGRVVDTWRSAGLRGTGSNDVEIDDAFASDAFSIGVHEVGGGPSPGSAVNPGPLWRLPLFALLPFTLAGVALGNAQACLEDFVAEARRRASRQNMARMADFQSVQLRIASAAAQIDAAGLTLRAPCREAGEIAAAGGVPDLRRKTRWRRDAAFAVGLCTQAVSQLVAASGAGGLAADGALQRRFRDAHAAAAHIDFNFDVAGAHYGRVVLGLPSENPVL